MQTTTITSVKYLGVRTTSKKELHEFDLGSDAAGSGTPLEVFRKSVGRIESSQKTTHTQPPAPITLKGIRQLPSLPSMSAMIAIGANTAPSAVPLCSRLLPMARSRLSRSNCTVFRPQGKCPDSN